jgi:hypothetical protein
VHAEMRRRTRRPAALGCERAPSGPRWVTSLAYGDRSVEFVATLAALPNSMFGGIAGASEDVDCVRYWSRLSAAVSPEIRDMHQ